MDEPDTRAYRSKIGRLPVAVRIDLCERMLDGAPGAVLVAWLNRRSDVKKTLKTFFYPHWIYPQSG